MLKISKTQQERYKRNLLLNDIGGSGQQKLLAGSVLVVGLGGLGSAVAYYLAAAGVGRLGLADKDTVDLSNLQRQILHTTLDVGRLKTDSASEKIAALNPDVSVDLYPFMIERDELIKIVRKYDFIIDATDNFKSKFLINDICVEGGVPFSHGGILEFSGQSMTVIPSQTACYRCIFGKIPDEKDVPPPSDSGVLGATAGMLGTIQAAEAVKYLTSAGSLLTNTLLTFDAKTMEFRRIKLSKQRMCPSCGKP